VFEALKKKLPAHIEVSDVRELNMLISKFTDKDGWYSRKGVNEWRTVSVKVLDPFYPSASIRHFMTQERVPASERFHYSTLERRQERLKKQKNKKITWLKKL
jgi:hypothetical protein